MKLTSFPSSPLTSSSLKSLDTQPAVPSNARALESPSRPGDGFEPALNQKGPGQMLNGCWGPSVGLNDRNVAGSLHQKLSNPLNDLVLNDPFAPDATLEQDDEAGVVRGPDGQPLVSVQLDDGNTAYVDPNTNQYYLSDGSGADEFGEIGTKGPLPLPPGARFSGAEFSDSDVQQLNRDAQNHFHMTPFPWPKHFPIDPLPPIYPNPSNLPVHPPADGLKTGFIKG